MPISNIGGAAKAGNSKKPPVDPRQKTQQEFLKSFPPGANGHDVKLWRQEMRQRVKERMNPVGE